ncbi:glycosyltransferase [Neobacillus drentensis]|uniref:glycosyltransferase n=1 Tax=Neobacillus drentensis TaxID=220684 RepID=UPI001F31B5DF|nr:glycosyltransferase [Neobacillus drentensis]ULT56779.1 glycosyltransferase [Neobacillus drentensis]
MKLLILVADYPRPDGYIALMYVHVRNKYYINHNIEVTVLNFNAKENYTIDGIPVITLENYKNNQEKMYDILICHAPNIRNHYRFLKKYEKNFSKLVFFFHGHEVLRINATYPKPYAFQEKLSIIKTNLQDLYDSIKLKIWHKYYVKLAYKSHFVFVSKWIYNEFLHWTKINSSILEGKYSIIHNGVGQVFEDNGYKLEVEKLYDFVTIRNNMDRPSYCLDIVNELAHNNPDLKFLLIGRGKFFDYVKKSDNITWINDVLSHKEIIDLLNKSRCGLLPTRQDTQGVMSCEMATFGLPLITSDIKICHEILGDFENVQFINNGNTAIDLKPILEKITKQVPYEKNVKYFLDNTCGAEIKLYKNIL